MNLYVTRNEAIEREIRGALAPGLADLDGPVADYYDVDAIADATIATTVTAGGQLRYCQAPDIDPDMFWDIVEQHAR